MKEMILWLLVGQIIIFIIGFLISNREWEKNLSQTETIILAVILNLVVFGVMFLIKS